MGKQRALELILTGRRMGAEQAQTFGLVNVVTDRKRWLQGGDEPGRAGRPPRFQGR